MFEHRRTLRQDPGDQAICLPSSIHFEIVGAVAVDDLSIVELDCQSDKSFE